MVFPSSAHRRVGRETRGSICSTLVSIWAQAIDEALISCLEVSAARARQSVLFPYLLGYGNNREESPMNNTSVLVTGATGFVGEAVLLRLLLDRKFVPVAAVRGASRFAGI